MQSTQIVLIAHTIVNPKVQLFVVFVSLATNVSEEQDSLSFNRRNTACSSVMLQAPNDKADPTDPVGSEWIG